ncbi:histidine phosphatase family protein [Paenibacillus filicis]|uniref:Histidine phosphatase family protein n=1 Tax=Paenibacillus filicis TaxID=669464 RepID=A0ABU9DFP5_9BACL
MKDTTTLYLVRHGQTEWNVEHRMQGHQDSPLTELGIRQANWLGDALQNERIDTVFSSTSRRAVRTAELIRGARELPVQESDEFREINLGIWEGRTQAEVKELFPVQFDQFWSDPEAFQVEGSETFRQVRERAAAKLDEILQAHPGRSILLVTHTVVVKLLMAYFENRPMNELWNLPYIHPACLCKIEVRNGIPEIILHGDIGHYREEAVEG